MSPPSPQDNLSAMGEKWPPRCKDPAGLAWFLSPGRLQVEWRGYDLMRQQQTRAPERSRTWGHLSAPRAAAWPPALRYSPPGLHPTPSGCFSETDLRT